MNIYTPCHTSVLSLWLHHYFYFLLTFTVDRSTMQNYIKSSKDIQYCISVSFASLETSKKSFVAHCQILYYFMSISFSRLDCSVILPAASHHHRCGGTHAKSSIVISEWKDLDIIQLCSCFCCFGPCFYWLWWRYTRSVIAKTRKHCCNKFRRGQKHEQLLYNQTGSNKSQYFCPIFDIIWR